MKTSVIANATKTKPIRAIALSVIVEILDAIMPIKFQQTREQQIEVMEWMARIGPKTPAVRDAIWRSVLTFGAALITRRYSDGYWKN